MIFVADWSEYDVHMPMLESCLDAQLAAGQLPAVQPFHAFAYPICLRKIKQLAIACALAAAHQA